RAAIALSAGRPPGLPELPAWNDVRVGVGFAITAPPRRLVRPTRPVQRSEKFRPKFRPRAAMGAPPAAGVGRGPAGGGPAVARRWTLRPRLPPRRGRRCHQGATQGADSASA